MQNDNQAIKELKSILNEHLPELTEIDCDSLLKFYFLVLSESKVQNLTRLLGPEDFFDNHIFDAVFFNNLGSSESNFLDFGTGCGSPGLICALLSKTNWVLVDSEKMKAHFLEKTVREIDFFKKPEVYHGRAEQYLRSAKKKFTITSKAVAKASKTLALISECSTWNQLYIFKGPKWDDEKGELAKYIVKNEIHEPVIIEYQSPIRKVNRKIIQIKKFHVEQG